MRSICLSVLFSALASCLAADETTGPNFVFMLSDDQGWNGLSVAMHPNIAGSKSDLYRTPNLEKLAGQGMRFSNAYAPASVCSPTRCSLQTGKSPAQLRWTKASPIMTAADGHKLIPPMHGKSLPAEETTIAEVLRKAGYATAHYGKWHLGGGGPERHGYDESDGDTGNQDAARFVDPNPVDIFGMSRRAIEFMDKNTKVGKPFFIQLSYHALHYPENALTTTREKYARLASGRNEKNMFRAAITEDLDTGVGMIMEGVDRLGIGSNTYLVYMSDNGAGGGGGRGSLSGGKGSVREGGIRVPLIVRGPGVPENSFCHERVVGYDLFPTICELAGVTDPLSNGIEGGSIVSLLSGAKERVKRPREELVFHFPHYQSSDGPHSAILLGNFKLLRFYEAGDEKLFDLSRDIGEQHDLAKDMPEKVVELAARLDRYIEDVGAALPVSNPSYDPAKPPQDRREQKQRRGGGGRDQRRRASNRPDRR
ncbi:MAG TPA: sulfatase [Thermoguttaceae bacterium]|nr:sulfatase [Thermoguttaceae bacterium]